MHTLAFINRAVKHFEFDYVNDHTLCVTQRPYGLIYLLYIASIAPRTHTDIGGEFAIKIAYIRE